MEIKTKVIQETIPEQIINKTIYCCPCCNYTNAYEGNVEYHYGDEHAAQDTMIVDSMRYPLVKLINYDDAECYIKIKAEDNGAEYYSNHWDGPGWYYIVAKDDDNESENFYLEPAYTIIPKLELEIKKAKHILDTIESV
jgi:hypothetical protein